ncbi:MAG: prolyl oligopeptidase family serine peptidase [Crocinitomicaceae bacterium]
MFKLNPHSLKLYTPGSLSLIVSLFTSHITKGIVVLFLLSSVTAFGQKKKITAETYDEWNHLENVQQSHSGKWVTYQLMPLEGDGSLKLVSVPENKTFNFDRGTNAVIHHQDEFVVFSIVPQHDTIRQLKLDKVKPDKFPKDSLGIYWTSKDSLALYPSVKSFKVSEEGDWLAYLSEKDNQPKPKGKKWWQIFRKKDKTKPSPTSGTTLYLIHPTQGISNEIHCVKDYVINKTGTLLAYSVSHKGEADTLSLYLFDLETLESSLLIEDQFDISKVQFDFNGDQLLFLSSEDSSKTKNYSLHYWENGLTSSKNIVDSITTGMPENWTVSKNYSPHFSRDGSSIYLGTHEILKEEEEDTLLRSEKAQVDIWGGEDLRIQPEQLKNLSRDKLKSYLGVYHLKESSFTQLANEKLDVVYPLNHGNASFALAIDNDPYRKERNWTFPWKSDYYKMDVFSGEKELIKKSLSYSGSLSPSGNYFIWYRGIDSSWVLKDLILQEETTLTEHLDAIFASDNNGMPFVPYPQGSSGWLKIDQEEYYVVEDYYDLWCLHPTDQNKTFCLTSAAGRKENKRFSLIRTEHDSLYLSLDRVLLKGVDDKTKNESLYQIEGSGQNYRLIKLMESNHKIVYFNKAKDSDRVLIRRSNFTQYPDLESTTLSFDNIEKISTANPQQDEYNWGTVEFVEWQAYDSTELRGLLYKPESFDSTKSYPMIVYFYEEYQDNIHFYYAPKPTASIVYPTEYVSNDYIVFIPDVRYEAGHPAKSAYNCIVSGTDYLVKKYGWIDSTRLGLQGQSWGGYQTAQLVTMTDKYSAAMAGAPVSNMFSAYGGIRWGSGMSRMFQYERTQSRIGYTIWERPDLYIENSPIFGLPEVETPLLIMHNDKDGAVPWYQGIELYMGLRRLNKDVWLLNYNNDDHNLRKLPNKRDLSIRMKQFFDHYLQNEPMPIWMKKGVSAVDKGIESGYETEK